AVQVHRHEPVRHAAEDVLAETLLALQALVQPRVLEDGAEVLPQRLEHDQVDSGKRRVAPIVGREHDAQERKRGAVPAAEPAALPEGRTGLGGEFLAPIAPFAGWRGWTARRFAAALLPFRRGRLACDERYDRVRATCWRVTETFAVQSTERM